MLGLVRFGEVRFASALIFNLHVIKGKLKDVITYLKDKFSLFIMFFFRSLKFI